ncbi:MAG: hypothetical protein IPK58_13085 [Acidobacteria bacterium]|nr:hypothetical protein [Acidobacteriota bacterium]
MSVLSFAAILRKRARKRNIPALIFKSKSPDAPILIPTAAALTLYGFCPLKSGREIVGGVAAVARPLTLAVLIRSYGRRRITWAGDRNDAAPEPPDESVPPRVSGLGPHAVVDANSRGVLREMGKFLGAYDRVPSGGSSDYRLQMLYK